jgi:hypothetical protein
MTTVLPEHYIDMGVQPDQRKPVFAILRIGKKDPERGHPIDKSNFYVVEPTAQARQFQKRGGQTYSVPSRALSQEFERFNEQKRRSTFHGILPYASMTDCWVVRRRADQLVGYPQHPNFLPTCETQDGKTATRLYQIENGDSTLPPEGSRPVEGKPDDEKWFSIPCPGSLCEFAQSGECKTRAWLYFIANEPNMPRVLMRYQTGGQSTTIQNIGAFFDDLYLMASSFGVKINNLAGIPFVLNLTLATSRKHGRQMPVVTMALDGTATEVLTAQRADAELAGGKIEVELLPEGETDTEEDLSLDIVDAEPSKPGTLFEDQA